MRAGVIGSEGRMGRWLMGHLKHVGFIPEPVEPRASTFDWESLRSLDLLVVSVPIGSTVDILGKVASYMKVGAILAEVASLKVQTNAALIEAEARNLIPLSVHPMFGPFTKCLKDRTVVVVPVISALKEMELARRIFPGAHLIQLDAKAHDEAITLILSLPYAINLAFARMLKGNDLELLRKLAGPTYALQSVLAESMIQESPTFIRDILSNRASLDSIKSFIDALIGINLVVKEEVAIDAYLDDLCLTLKADPLFEDAAKLKQRAFQAIS